MINCCKTQFFQDSKHRPVVNRNDLYQCTYIFQLLSSSFVVFAEILLYLPQHASVRALPVYASTYDLLLLSCVVQIPVGD